MDDATPDPTPPRRTARVALGGAIVGALALAGTVVGVGTLAGAQDAPDTDPPAEEATTAESAEDHEGDLDLDDSAWEAEEAAWQAFDECMAGELGDLWIEPEIVEFEGEFDPEEFDPEDLEFDDEFFDEEFEEWPEFDEATEQAWVDAEAACEQHLPEDVRAEMAAWEAFDECLTDQLGDLDELEPFEFGTVVHVEGPDGFQMIEFGETAGTVTITGDVDGVEVSTEGGVTVLDEAALEAEWEAFDAAHEACEDLLPEDVFFDDEWDEGDWDDEWDEEFDAEDED